jgi:hypothetical protein
VLPFARAAVMQLSAWKLQAGVLLLLPMCRDACDGSIHQAAKQAKLKVLAKYLSAAAEQMTRFYKIALMLEVTAEQLPAEADLLQLVKQCRDVVQSLPVDKPDVVTLVDFKDVDSLEQRASTLLHKIPDNFLVADLHNLLMRYMVLDAEELSSKTSLASACKAHGLDPSELVKGTKGGSGSKLHCSPKWARFSNIGITAPEILAAYILLDAKCPVDGLEISLTSTPHATPTTSRRISADRVYGQTGFHTLLGCVLVSSSANLERKHRLDAM